MSVPAAGGAPSMTHDYDPATYRCTCGELFAYRDEHLQHQIAATERPTKEKP